MARFLRKQFDLCESVWQIDVSFEDTGSGASQKQISIVPADSEVRILSLALDGKPQSYTAFMDSNRVEFTLRRGPSGYKCSRQLEALLSNGKTFNKQVDLCANNNEVVLDMEPDREYFEVFTVRTTVSDDRITVVRVDGRRVPILRWITKGVRTRLAVGAGAFECEADIKVEFASGATASVKRDICAENFDVTLTPKPQYVTDTSLSTGFTWRFTAPRSADDQAQIRFASNNRAAGFVAVCDPGSREADIYITGFPNRAQLSGRVDLEMWAGRYQGNQSAIIGRAPGGPDNAAPRFTLSTSNGLWNGLIAGSAHTLIADDVHRLRLSLKGSAGPVREFVRACNQRFNGPSVIGDVTGDASLKWSNSRMSNGQHRLIFGDVSTDRIGLEARCVPGDGFAEIMFASAPIGMSQFTDLDVFWDTVGNQGTMFARTRNVPGIEWGTVPISKAEMSDPFWGSLAAGNIVHIVMDGERMATYSLKGSAGPVRNFVAACKPYIPEPEPDPVTPDQPTREEEVLNTFLDIFGAISERSNGQFKVEIEGGNIGAKRALEAYQSNPNFLCTQTEVPTPTGQNRVRSSFVNRGGDVLDLFEITSNGQRQRVRDIPPGARLSVTAQSGQSWEIRKRNGGCVARLASPDRDVQFSVNANMARADQDAFVKTYQCGGRTAYALIAPNHGLAIIDGQFAVVRAEVAGRSQNIWGRTSASISNEQLVVRGGNAPNMDCVAR